MGFPLVFPLSALALFVLNKGCGTDSEVTFTVPVIHESLGDKVGCESIDAHTQTNSLLMRL